MLVTHGTHVDCTRPQHQKTTTFELDPPLLYRLSYQARADQVVRKLFVPSFVLRGSTLIWDVTMSSSHNPSIFLLWFAGMGREGRAIRRELRFPDYYYSHRIGVEGPFLIQKLSLTLNPLLSSSLSNNALLSSSPFAGEES